MIWSGVPDRGRSVALPILSECELKNEGSDPSFSKASLKVECTEEAVRILQSYVIKRGPLLLGLTEA